MDRFWWQIPGPNQYVADIVQDLIDGKNVVLCLPKHMPAGLSSAVRLEIGEEWHWQTFSLLEENETEPVHQLFNIFVREISPTEIRNARTLAQHQDFGGKIIWIENLTPPLWGPWKKFLTNYEQSCRSVSKWNRTLFCVPLIGDLAIDPPREDVCLSHHYWRGVVDRLDILLFTAHLFSGKQLSDLQKQIAISAIANLALWDPNVSEWLADETLENILNPLPILLEIGQSRCWCDEMISSGSDSWHRGVKDMIEGEEKIHSAALAFNDSTREIDRRIWSAQVGVLLPFVEERRQELLSICKDILTVPFQTNFGVISDLRDLEIGHIEYQLSTNPAGNRNIKRLAEQLKDIRNALSHLEPINHQLLLSREINDWRRILGK
jgi:hypothetical protein